MNEKFNMAAVIMQASRTGAARRRCHSLIRRRHPRRLAPPRLRRVAQAPRAPSARRGSLQRRRVEETRRRRASCRCRARRRRRAARRARAPCAPLATTDRLGQQAGSSCKQITCDHTMWDTSGLPQRAKGAYGRHLHSSVSVIMTAVIRCAGRAPLREVAEVLPAVAGI
jgi:hypothetical protein